MYLLFSGLGLRDIGTADYKKFNKPSREEEDDASPRR